MYECNVIIVCWDALEYTKTTINSLFESTSNYNYRLTIIDNNSKPNAIEYLKSIEPPSNIKMDIIYNNSNVGICKINKQIYRNSLRILQFPDSTSSCICMARTSVLERIGYFASSKFCGYGFGVYCYSY